jgi:hypothetical protein
MLDSDRERKKGLGCSIGLLIGIVSLPILYFLSYGPAVWLSYNDYVDNVWLEVFYYPLALLKRNSDWFKELLRWYERFWHP